MHAIVFHHANVYALYATRLGIVALQGCVVLVRMVKASSADPRTESRRGARHEHREISMIDFLLFLSLDLSSQPKQSAVSIRSVFSNLP